MTILWIVVAVAVVVILAGVVASAASKRQAERDRREACEQQYRAMTSDAQARKQQAVADSAEYHDQAQNLWPDREAAWDRDGAADQPHWADGTHPQDPRHSKHSRH